MVNLGQSLGRIHREHDRNAPALYTRLPPTMYASLPQQAVPGTPKAVTAPSR